MLFLLLAEPSILHKKRPDGFSFRSRCSSFVYIVCVVHRLNMESSIEIKSVINIVSKMENTFRFLVLATVNCFSMCLCRTVDTSRASCVDGSINDDAFHMVRRVRFSMCFFIGSFSSFQTIFMIFESNAYSAQVKCTHRNRFSSFVTTIYFYIVAKWGTRTLNRWCFLLRKFHRFTRMPESVQKFNKWSKYVLGAVESLSMSDVCCPNFWMYQKYFLLRLAPLSKFKLIHSICTYIRVVYRNPIPKIMNLAVINKYAGEFFFLLLILLSVGCHSHIHNFTGT